MKKAYMAPALEVEVFELNSAIASGCSTKVNVGPGDYQNDACSDWDNPFGDDEDAIMTVDSASFYENTCHCYYSSGGEGWMTS